LIVEEVRRIAKMAENKLQLPEINWPRVGDYLLGRSTLIGIASLMLLMISGYATWHGMRDFIIGVSSTHSQESQDGLSVSHDLLVVVVVGRSHFSCGWCCAKPLDRSVASPNA
jgi:hypothetical protein